MPSFLRRALASAGCATFALAVAAQPAVPMHAHRAQPAPAVLPAAALVDVHDAWVRPAVAGQSGTGAFMALTAREPLQLVGVETPAAARAEVHEMRLEAAGVMRMRAIDALALPAGTPVALRPGGHHLMLTELRAPLAVGASVPLVLLLRDAAGNTRRQGIVAPVRAAAGAPAAGHGGPAGHASPTGHAGHGH